MSPMTAKDDATVWAAGKLYEPYVGRWSRLVAREFVAWLALPAQQAWLDVGCGTGQWAFEICDQFPDVVVVGLDLVGQAGGLRRRADLLEEHLVRPHPPREDGSRPRSARRRASGASHPGGGCRE